LIWSRIVAFMIKDFIFNESKIDIRRRVSTN